MTSADSKKKKKALTRRWLKKEVLTFEVIKNIWDGKTIILLEAGGGQIEKWNGYIKSSIVGQI